MNPEPPSREEQMLGYRALGIVGLVLLAAFAVCYRSSNSPANGDTVPAAAERISAPVAATQPSNFGDQPTTVECGAQTLIVEVTRIDGHPNSFA